MMFILYATGTLHATLTGEWWDINTNFISEKPLNCIA